MVMADIDFNHEFHFRYGVVERVSPLIRRVVARNPGPFTGPGTGTYIIGVGEVAVIDPGPMLPDHVDALLDGLVGETVSHIVITHTHVDHSPAARLLSARTGAAVFGSKPHAELSAGELEGGVDREYAPDFPLDHGESVSGDGWTLKAIHTPGHCSNHLCFSLPEESALFCGDHVMAWATPVIIPPDGSIADYIQSLDRLSEGTERTYYPTHGAPIEDPASFLAQVRAHRMSRVEQVETALQSGYGDLHSLRARVYRELPASLHAGAELSLLASLRYLEAHGRARIIRQDSVIRFKAV
jgi:glyoxylase-like metal-dependent hydrolase (beta-lactamase superfamily II)